MVKQGVFRLELLPPGRRAVRSLWVFKTKLNGNGSVARKKGRACAAGNTKVAGVDYTEMFAPTVHFTTVRLFLTLAAWIGWPVHTVDINVAFLNSLLQDVIYMVPPPGATSNMTPKGAL